MQEDPNLQEEVQETTPQEEGESSNSESNELDALFAVDDSQEAPVTREEFNALKKGVSKYFSEQGRKAKEEKKAEEVKTEPAKANTVLRSLYFKSNPEAETVWSKVEQEAARLQKDPYELYEESSYFKGEAKVLYEKMKVEEDAKSKVGAPSSLVRGGKLSYDKINLENPEHLKWLKEKPDRITEYNEWIKLNWKH